MSNIGAWDPVAAFNEQQGSGIIAGSSPVRRKPCGDLVYETNRWQRYLWDGFKDDSSEARGVEEVGAKDVERWGDYMREMFTRFYAERPERIEEIDPANGWAERAHDLAGELPEFKRLRDRCMGDKLWSGMAASSIATEVLSALPKPDEKIKDTQPMERQVQGLEGLQGAGVPCEAELQAAKEALAKAQASAQGYAQGIDDGAIRQAMRRGCEEAQRDIDGAEQAMSSFGWGSEAGEMGRGGDSDTKRELFKRVRDSKKLQALAELAGRMKRLAAQKQRSKTDHARDEVSDIKQGDDLARLLPSELAKLTNPLTRKLFHKAWIEKALLCYELRGTEPQKKGPIVVCVDNSGSMSGDRELWSKAVALALLDIARRQKRSFALIHFDTRIGYVLEAPKDKTTSWEKILEAMEYFSGGGTDFSPPLQHALRVLERDEFNKADVIMVTDGCASDSFAKQYRQRAKDKEATTYGILIGGYGASALSSFCDHTMTIDDLENDGAATDALFDI